jgi:hypothetical protein
VHCNQYSDCQSRKVPEKSIDEHLDDVEFVAGNKNEELRDETFNSTDLPLETSQKRHADEDSRARQKSVD